MSEYWHYIIGEKEIGPTSSAELRALALAGKIQPGTLVRKGEQSRWVSAAAVKGLFGGGIAPKPTNAAIVPARVLAPDAVSLPPKLQNADRRSLVGASTDTRRIAIYLLTIAVTLLLGLAVVLIIIILRRESPTAAPLNSPAATQGIDKKPPLNSPAVAPPRKLSAVFAAAMRAARSVQGGADFGLSQDQFREKLQAFSTELLILGDERLVGPEANVCVELNTGLQLYRDSLVLWRLKAKTPAEGRFTEELLHDGVRRGYLKDKEKDSFVNEIAHIQSGEIATLVRDESDPTGFDWADSHEAPRIARENGIVTDGLFLPGDSVQRVWAAAEKHIDNASKLIRGSDGE